MIQALDILIAEDDAVLRDAVRLTLECAGHRTAPVADGGGALAQLDERDFHLVLSDLRMAPMDGLQLLGEVRRRAPHLPVLLMTAHGDVDSAVAAMRAGACDFLQKPFAPDALVAAVERYAVAPLVADEIATRDMIAADPRTRTLLGLAGRVAESDATVLLSGESGTGKEVFARFIHRASRRRDGPFVAINCAAIPDSLLEATLFGHEKGAFTGAAGPQPGKFEQAEGGTLLLDEISEMPLALQAKLLRVLQEREVERVGGRKPIALDIRIVATSNRDMAGEVRRGRFREDLYYRLAVFPLAIPALRERPGDIVPLAEAFLARAAARSSRLVRLEPEAAAILAAHAWPGNVRELENTIQRAMILAPGALIAPEHLQLPRVANASIAEAAQVAGPGNIRQLERQHILDTLRAVGGSRKQAVARLGISERTLRYKLRQYRSEGSV